MPANSVSNARHTLFRIGDLEEAAWRRWDLLHQRLTDFQGPWPPHTNHGGTRRGGGISDPTGDAATNPESDRARIDLHEAYADARQLADLLTGIDGLVAHTLGLRPPPAGSARPLRTPELRTPEHAAAAFDTIGTICLNLAGAPRDPAHTTRWHAYHWKTGDTLDGAEAYSDLRLALAVADRLVNGIMCHWLGGDPVLAYCGNTKGCPTNPTPPPAVGSHRCWACDRHYHRARGLKLPEPEWERTRRSDEAAVAAVAPSNGLLGGEQGPWNPNGSQAATEPHSAPPDPWGINAWRAANIPPTEGAA